MKKKGKRGKKPITQKLRDDADKLLQEKFCSVNRSCLVCGNSNGVVGHHYIFKSQSNYLRFDMDNLVPLCPVCHTKLHLSGDPDIVATILKKKGMAWHDELQSKRRTLCKFNKQYLSGIIEELNGKL